MQCRAARFVKSRYSRYSSDSDMLDVFGCLFLKRDKRLVHTTSQSFSPKTISAWNRLAFGEAMSLGVFGSNFINN